MVLRSLNIYVPQISKQQNDKNLVSMGPKNLSKIGSTGAFGKRSFNGSKKSVSMIPSITLYC